MDACLYDPRLGRFLEVDPVEGGSCNNYDYTCGDPMNLADLSGRNMDADEFLDRVSSVAEFLGTGWIDQVHNHAHQIAVWLAENNSIPGVPSVRRRWER